MIRFYRRAIALLKYLTGFCHVQGSDRAGVEAIAEISRRSKIVVKAKWLPVSIPDGVEITVEVEIE